MALDETSQPLELLLSQGLAVLCQALAAAGAKRVG